MISEVDATEEIKLLKLLSLLRSSCSFCRGERCRSLFDPVFVLAFALVPVLATCSFSLFLVSTCSCLRSCFSFVFCFLFLVRVCALVLVQVIVLPNSHSRSSNSGSRGVVITQTLFATFPKAQGAGSLHR